MARDRCRAEDFYPVASTPMPANVDSLSATSGASAISCNVASSNQQHHQHHIHPTQHQQQQQHQHQQNQHQHQLHQQHQLAMSPAPPNVSSVLYTVQRVVTTSQIQSNLLPGPNNQQSSSSTVTYTSSATVSNGAAASGMMRSGGAGDGNGIGGDCVSNSSGLQIPSGMFRLLIFFNTAYIFAY